MAPELGENLLNMGKQGWLLSWRDSAEYGEARMAAEVGEN
jgi:hypothetical protein